MATQTLPVSSWPCPDGSGQCAIRIDYDDVTLLVTTVVINKTQASYRPTLEVVHDPDGAVVYGPVRLPQGTSASYDVSSFGYAIFYDADNQPQFPFHLQFA